MATTSPLNILVDRREVRILKEFDRRGLKVQIEQLESPDVVFSDTIAVEYKGPRESKIPSHDFTDSMRDGRLEEEIPRELSMYPGLLVIVEQLEDCFTTNFNPKSIEGMLRKIKVDWHVPVIATSCVAKTVDELLEIAKRVAKLGDSKPIRKYKPHHDAPEGYRLDFYQSFIDVGPTIALRIDEVYQTPLNFLNALLGAHLGQTAKGYKYLEDTPLKTVLGPKCAWDNRRMLGA